MERAASAPTYFVGPHVTYTQRRLRRYEIQVHNDELGKSRTIRGVELADVERKAEEQKAKWDLMWAKQDAKQEAQERTEEAQLALEELDIILRLTLGVDDTVNWKTLRQNQPFALAQPRRRENPPTVPGLKLPGEPDRFSSVFAPQYSFLDRLLPKRRAERDAEADTRVASAQRSWQDRVSALTEEHAKRTAEHEAEVEKIERDHARAMKAWETRHAKYQAEQSSYNDKLSALEQAYMESEPEAVLFYCDVVLSRSSYPEYFPQEFEMEYREGAKLLVIDYQLPDPATLPTLREVRFVASRAEFSEKHVSDAEARRRFDSVIYQVVLRTVHELFEADAASALDGIVFNGWVRSTDPSTGHESNSCIISLQTGKEEFMAINLGAVDPKACFKGLKGVASSKLHSVTPVAPIANIVREDSRFVASREVVGGITEGDNLASMNWEDFEHLIREIFEKEFAEGGGEVKVTQASRDGGVDAIVFDPDPIRGGKIVIQAKRYTNTVGVAAVRDLFGTVVNEGANKGILVTTSDYGPDAYSFASGKPLSLLNGGNLLHLLAKHGHAARIDVKEAREAMNS